jgi:8-oxo-dGTP pyrophosphatase MutT (NUDIX family)
MSSVKESKPIRDSPPQGLKAISGVIPFRRNDSGEIMVLVQRRSNERLGLIGGNHESHETLLQSAIRECKEECGYTPHRDEVVDSIEGESKTHYSMNLVVDATNWPLVWENNGSTNYEVTNFKVDGTIDACFGHGWVTKKVFQKVRDQMPSHMRKAIDKVFKM